MQEISWGYVAGLFDGEGSVSYPGIHQPIMVISNTNKELIDWLQNILGGKVYTVAPKTPNHKIAYAWRLHGRKEVYRVLCQIQRHCIVKREAIIKALLMIENHSQDSLNS